MAYTKTVTMTHEQWVTLTSYLLMTTNHRKGEREAWERLATETDENGKPSFPNAPSNAKFWADTERELEEIRTIIDRAKLQGD